MKPWMRAPLLVACVTSLIVASRAPARGAGSDGMKAFVGARLFDGTGRPPQPDAVLVVKDGRVTSVGSARDVRVPPGAERIDLSGRFVIPGLVNAHGHVGETRGKMPPAVYRAVIDEAHKHGLRVAAHIFYMEDARDLVASGADMIAHSVRDRPVDPAFVEALKARHICVCPTLMREVSAFNNGQDNRSARLQIEVVAGSVCLPTCAPPVSPRR